ncbi:hypothetical protein COOONC_02756, partial [Cooperia oncophora]
LDFYVTCAVCTKTTPQNLQIIRKNCQKVYASPSRRSMDNKGLSEEITYPKLYFAVDAFEEVRFHFCSIPEYQTLQEDYSIKNSTGRNTIIYYCHLVVTINGKKSTMG